jgi:pimeloyl-ACP methyl ester carboxylesterase
MRALLHDAVDAVTSLVEETHQACAQTPVALLSAVPVVGPVADLVDAIHGGIAEIAYGAVRTANQGTRLVLDSVAEAADQAGLSQAATQLLRLSLDPVQLRALGRWGELAQSALNAWVGDFLARQGNELAVTMGFWRRAAAVSWTPEGILAACPDATSKLCIFVHGLGCNEGAWRFRALEQHGDAEADYASLLARDLGYTSLHLRYNTGLHVSTNARELAERLEQLLRLYPCPIESVALVGHSMGGLVSRGAAHYSQAAGHRWVKRLTHVLCIGSPNLGAPLEQATHLLSSLLASFETAGTQVPAKLLNTRSAGIKDLRFGYVLDEDWTDKDPDAFLRDERHDVPMLDGVTYGFIAATFLSDPAHPLGALLGDLLVRVPSAAGSAVEPARSVRFHIGGVLHGVHHIALLNHPRVYPLVSRFLSGRALPERQAPASAGASV